MPPSRTARRATRTGAPVRRALAVHKGRRATRRKARVSAAGKLRAVPVRVADVMSQPVVTIGTAATLFEALMLLRSRGASGLPVVGRAGTVVGVISERDVARVMMGGTCSPKVRGILDMLVVGFEQEPLESLRDLREKLESTRVEEVMSAPPFVIGPEDRVDLAAEIMREHEINRLPVVKRGRPVGIITRLDLIRAMVRSTSR